MFLHAPKSFARALGVMVFAVVCGLFASTGTALLAMEGPFSNLDGSWSGPGTISLSSGSKERIRCRSTNRAENNGASVEISIRCASDSYKFELQTSVAYANGAVTGFWSESTRGVAGTITGTASSGRIQASATGPYLSATLVMITRGNHQTISIQSPGTEIAGVSISLSKGSR